MGVTTIGEATSTSTSSSGMNRELKKQKVDDMPEPVAPRSLFQEPGEEMLTEEPMQERGQPQSAPQAQGSKKEVPAEASHDDFWKRFGGMLDTRLETLGSQWATALTTAENRLITQIGTETAKRSEDNARMNERIDHITERLAALENKKSSNDNDENAPRDTKQPEGWRPRQIVLGGWPDRTPRDFVEREAAEWLRSTPENIQEACLKPFAPRTFGDMSPLEVKETMVSDVGWQIARLLEKTAPGGKPPTWSVVERSPEEGKRHRLTTEASERALKVLGPEFEVERNGCIYNQGIESTKYVGIAERWI